MQAQAREMTKPATVDRRGQTRIEPEERFKVHILALGERTEGYLEDINNVGAFVATSLRLKKGTRIHLEIEIPGQTQPSVLQAFVARLRAGENDSQNTSPSGLGLMFITDSEEDLRLVSRVVTTALAIDLLGQDKSKKRAGGPSDTLSYGRPFYRSPRRTE